MSGEMLKELLDTVYEKVRKETSEEIFYGLKKLHIEDTGYLVSFNMYDFNSFFARHFGIEDII